MTKKHDLIFFSNRSTSLVVDKGAPPSNNSNYDPETYGKQTSRRAADESEEKDIAAGRWVPTTESGKKQGEKGRKKSKMPGRAHLYHDGIDVDKVDEFLGRKE